MLHSLNLLAFLAAWRFQVLERVLKSFFPPIVIPANAGIQRFDLRLLDSRLRGNDGGLSFKTHS